MEDFVRSLPAGEPIDLIREPGNQHDRCAVQAWARGRHVGFVKATQARQLAPKLDRDAAVGRYGSKLAMDSGVGGITGKLVNERWPCVEVEE